MKDTKDEKKLLSTIEGTHRYYFNNTITYIINIS